MSAAAARVLEALRGADERPCSGARLSSELGVSRAQVWKHVESLRARGYRIEGAPGDGYRLRATPDRLYPEELARGLETRWLAHRIEHHESLDSTNRVAAERARAGAPHGLALIAEGQTAGRGRHGRAFFSPPHENLYVSFVLRPALSTAQAPGTMVAAGIAVAESVAAEVGDAAAVELKWPNDVLLGGRKTSGILVELASEETRVAHLVLGIGVNLNVDPDRFPAEFRARATSLRGFLGRRIDRVAFARRLFGTLEAVLDLHAERGFAALRPRFESLFRMTGERVRVAEPGGAAREGRVLGVGDDGALELCGDAGSRERVWAGDISLLSRQDPQ